jgi:hypothetical protein
VGLIQYSPVSHYLSPVLSVGPTESSRISHYLPVVLRLGPITYRISLAHAVQVRCVLQAGVKAGGSLRSRFAEEVEEARGLEKIEMLQHHTDRKIYEKASARTQPVLCPLSPKPSHLKPHVMRIDF